MANKITEECASCGACESDCPNAAISEHEGVYSIDPSKCDECAGKAEPACKAACPNDAIVKA